MGSLVQKRLKGLLDWLDPILSYDTEEDGVIRKRITSEVVLEIVGVNSRTNSHCCLIYLWEGWEEGCKIPSNANLIYTSDYLMFQQIPKEVDCITSWIMNGKETKKPVMTDKATTSNIPMLMVDYIGERFDHLLVIGKEKRNGKIYWKCRCDCGEYCYKLTANLGKHEGSFCGNCIRGRRSPLNKALIDKGYRNKSTVAHTIGATTRDIYAICKGERIANHDEVKGLARLMGISEHEVEALSQETVSIKKEHEHESHR